MSQLQQTNEKSYSDIDVRKETFRLSELKPVLEVPRSEVGQAGLNTLLANEFTLFTKTLNYHWNVTGPRFHSVHEFLGAHYKKLLEVIDNVAERIREIGGQPVGTVQEMNQLAFIKERPGVFPETSEMIRDLLSDHESLNLQVKNLIERTEDKGNDPATVDFLTTLLKEHEEMAWMLRSHLGEK